ncbi:TPA: hypothetical protein QHS04_002738 [Morganella morganii subsp. morganii]|nr:hypothetical protein [Morganella morganii subsp. morganii]
MKLSILSAVSLFFNTLIILIITYNYGLSASSDNIFLAITLCNFLAYIPQCSWEAIMLKIVKNKDNCTIISNGLLLNAVITIIIGIALYSTRIINIDFLYQKEVWTEISDYSIYYLLLSLQMYIKRVIHSLGYISKMYICDIIYGLICSALIYSLNVAHMEYVFFSISMLISVTYGLFVIKHKITLSRKIFFFDKELIINSTKLKIGSISYSFKDVLFPSILMNLSPGYFTAYNFASKILNAILLVVITPQNNTFILRCIESINKNASFIVIKRDLFHIMIKTIIMYAALIISILLINEAISYAHIAKKIPQNIVFIFSLLSIYYAIVVIEQPVSRLVFALGKMTETMIINIINLIIFISIYYLYSSQLNSLYFIFYLLAIPQIANIILYFYFAKEVIFEKDNICN